MYVELSQDFHTTAVERIFRVSGSVGTSSVGPLATPWGGSSASSYSRLFIRSGSVPSTAVTGSIASTGYTNNVLATILTSNLFGSNLSAHQTVGNARQVVINSQYVTVATTGTATHFVLTLLGNNQFGDPATVFHSIIGDVGVLGSGADLEMSDVDLVQGQQIRIQNLRFTIPRIFEA